MEFELPSLGWNASFEEEWQRISSPGEVPARIAAEHRGAYEAWAAGGSGWSRVAGRLRHETKELPGVGDWVALDASPGPDRTAVIQRILDRREKSAIQGSIARPTAPATTPRATENAEISHGEAPGLLNSRTISLSCFV